MHRAPRLDAPGAYRRARAGQDLRLRARPPLRPAAARLRLVELRLDER